LGGSPAWTGSWTRVAKAFHFKIRRANAAGKEF
jgi:hypothetical protein